MKIFFLCVCLLFDITGIVVFPQHKIKRGVKRKQTSAAAASPALTHTSLKSSSTLAEVSFCIRKTKWSNSSNSKMVEPILKFYSKVRLHFEVNTKGVAFGSLGGSRSANLHPEPVNLRIRINWEFYWLTFQLPEPDEVIQRKLWEAARELLAKKKSKEVLSPEELTVSSLVCNFTFPSHRRPRHTFYSW